MYNITYVFGKCLSDFIFILRFIMYIFFDAQKHLPMKLEINKITSIELLGTYAHIYLPTHVLAFKFLVIYFELKWSFVMYGN